MSEIPMMKMKVLRNHNANLTENTDDPSTTEGGGGGGDKQYFSGNFDGFEDDQELFLMPKRSTKNNCATFLRVTFYTLSTVAVIFVVYLIARDFMDTPYVHPTVKMKQKESLYQGKCSAQEKYDCYPRDSSEEGCTQRGCCWHPLEPNSAAPWCFFENDIQFYSWSDFNETEFGYRGRALLKNNTSLPYPKAVTELQIDLYFETENTLRIKIFDPHNRRFEVPAEYYNNTYTKSKSTNYGLRMLPNGLEVYRKSNNEILFNTINGPLIFTDQFIELTTDLGAEYIYGLGEQVDTLRRSSNWSRSVLWNHDSVPMENKNLYGSHPFALSLNRVKGEAHGVFLLNSNAMEIILQKKRGSTVATFRTIGGILDFRVFLGPKPSHVIQQYTDVIGKPMLPPYWALGFHLCRFNYQTVNHTSEILEQNIKAGIPIDVQWNDLDYMEHQNDFTYDAVKYAGLPEFVKSLHERGMRYIPLIDPAISGGEPAGTYPPYDEGTKQDIFVKNHRGEVFVGKVWNPDKSVWPDFSHPNSTHYWMNQIDSFHKKVPIDGAWIDMNDPSNFWDGEKDGCPENSVLDHPPYVPHVDGDKLYYKTLCMSAQQYGGKHYDLHNLYALQETITTYKALADVFSQSDVGQRPFIISRSSFPGHGRWGGSWTGDVVSSWEDMRKSIPQILSYGLYGINTIGADICGFNGNTTKELCLRWMQLGSFYPFSRNHNTDDGIPQDPVSLGQDVVDASKETLNLRYQLLPYIYSLFFHGHKTGEPVARPLFYEFPEDIFTYEIETQFMLGPSILISPILTPGFSANQMEVYVPKGWWYPHYGTRTAFESLGEMRSLFVPKNSIPILYKGGSIIVTQTANQTTTDSRKNKFQIRVYLSKNLNASGELFWDDGISNYYVSQYNQFQLTATNNDCRMEVKNYAYQDEKMFLETIEIHGVRGNVSDVLLNNVNFKYDYDPTSLIFTVANLTLDMQPGFSLKWQT